MLLLKGLHRDGILRIELELRAAFGFTGFSRIRYRTGGGLGARRRIGTRAAQAAEPAHMVAPRTNVERAGPAHTV